MLLFFFQMLLFSLTARGDGFPVGFENPMGLGDGQKFNPAHVDGDGDGFAIFSWGWVWTSKTRWVSSPLPS